MRKTTVLKSLLLAVLVVGLAAGSAMAWPIGLWRVAQAQAQTQPATPVAQAANQGCGVVTAQGTSAQTPPSYPGYPYGEDGGYSQPTPPPEPKPQNPVQKICEDGRIIIQVGNAQHFGHRIMDLIEITVVIVADKDVKFDFTSLEKGVIGFDGSDFDLAKTQPEGALPPGQKAVTIRSAPFNKDGSKIIYRIDLIVQSSVPPVVKTNIVFNLDLRYATDMTADGKTPNWKRLTTPDFVVTTSPTADNGDELLEGDLEQKGAPSPWLMWPLLVLGGFLFLVWPGITIVRYINRARPRRVMSPAEKAWRIFLKVEAEVKVSGWTPAQYKLMASAFRTYLGVEPATTLEAQERLKDHPQIESIMSALTKCDSVLYHGATLSDEQNDQLVEEFVNLVPRPVLL